MMINNVPIPNGKIKYKSCVPQDKREVSVFGRHLSTREESTKRNADRKLNPLDAVQDRPIRIAVLLARPFFLNGLVTDWYLS